jgi:HAD superfamily hydrolase (TIGR01509 family)
VPIAAALFDRDGVLTYFDVKAAAAFFQELLPISVDEMSMRWRIWTAHNSAPKSLEQESDYLRDFWDESADALALTMEQRQSLHDLDYTRFVVAYPEAPGILQALRSSGIKIGVLSNFGLASLDASLASAGLMPLIDVALAAPVIGVSKPHARAYAIALEALGVTADQCLYFDDELEHVESACALGIDGFLVDRRLTQHDIATKKVADLKGVLQIVSHPQRASA